MVRYYCDRCDREVTQADIERLDLGVMLCPTCADAFHVWMESHPENAEWLLDAVERLLAEAREKVDQCVISPFEGDAINWLSMYCSDVRQFMDGTWQVTIVGADPNARRIRAWLRDRLAEAGWPQVEVVTEW